PRSAGRAGEPAPPPAKHGLVSRLAMEAGIGPAATKTAASRPRRAVRRLLTVSGEEVIVISAGQGNGRSGTQSVRVSAPQPERGGRSAGLRRDYRGFVGGAARRVRA